VTSFGECAYCHVGEVAGIGRIWIVPENADRRYGETGFLCYSCHDGSVAASTDITTTAWDIRLGEPGGSHGLNRRSDGSSVGYLMPGTAVSSRLPHGDGTPTAPFECTTCHDPHNDADGSLAMLREDMDGLCDTCHFSRGAGDSEWVRVQGNGFGRLNLIGSHPLGNDVYGDSSDPGNSPVTVGQGYEPGKSSLDRPYVDKGTGRHLLGGHLINGGSGTGITCVTCHAVHGTVDDGTQVSIPEDLLSIAQGVQGNLPEKLSGDGFIANGGEGTTSGNGLCESCHGVSPETWNPGGTLYSHPVNGQGHNIIQDIAAIPLGWPYSAKLGPSGTPSPLCETCHRAHGAAAGSHILRAEESLFCENCHKSTIPGHHPVGVGLLTESGMADPEIGNGDGDLTCSDCHAASGGHNWPDQGMPGLDPDWEPDTSGNPVYSDNGRKALAALTAGSRALVLENTSKECLDCHTEGESRQSPTRFQSHDNSSPYDDYEDMGDGTHWLGNTTIDWLNGEMNDEPFDARTGKWGNGGYSRFAGTEADLEVVCESCHSLRPPWNDGYTIQTENVTSLLLHDSYEGMDEDDSELCEGCHGHDPHSATSHPMTGDVVSKADDMGGNPNTLISFGQTRSTVSTSSAPSFMNENALDNATIPGANRMNCDSCHQVHNANTYAGTWILELTPSELAAGTFPSPTGILYGDAYNLDGNSWNNNYQELCYNCHAY
jgi:predicted CXXCH cytochrome family protein